MFRQNDPGYRVFALAELAIISFEISLLTGEMAFHSDFIRFIAYHDILGPIRSSTTSGRSRC